MISVPHFYHSVAVLLFKLPVGKKNTPAGEEKKGCEFFCALKLPPLRTVSQQFCYRL